MYRKLQSNWISLIVSCMCSVHSPASVRAEEQITKFEYSYNGGGKTRAFGEISKDKFHIQQSSSYPSDYDKQGSTSERSWALIEWLFVYGTKPRESDRGSFGATFTMTNSESIKRSFDVTHEHIALFQILYDCKNPDAENGIYPKRKSQLVKFEYACESDKLSGSISKEKFKIAQKSGQTTDYEKEGNTQERSWELIKWLFKFGIKPDKDADANSFFTVSFHTADEQVEKLNLSTRNNIILYQIIQDFRAP